jgi:hypothetical protein
MPILYKYPERVMFAHIPKTAGTSIYAWFADNGWIISNLKLNSPGSKDIFLPRYGIFQCQMEGEQEMGVPSQHTTSSTYLQWGKFTSGFVIVRHPFSRFISELNYYYHILCYQQKIFAPNKKVALLYAEEFINHVFLEYKKNSKVRDNHIRHQSDFISDKTKVLYFEKDWKGYLAEKYKLRGQIPHFNSSNDKVDFSKMITAEKKQLIIDFYKKDFELLGYSFP